MHCVVDSPVGRLRLDAQEGFITGVNRTDEPLLPPDPAAPDGGLLCLCAQQLSAYFAGSLRVFDVPVRLTDTPFRMRAWAELQRIPYGETISYGEQARRMGCPKASRAVGGANHHNPVSIIVPCHRVVGADGSLTGYGGGIDMKSWLLEHERKHQ